MITIVDEKVEIEKKLREEAAINVRKDRTYDDFTKQYLPHIEGHIDPNLRCADRPETAAFDPNKIKPRGKKTENIEEEEKIEYAKLVRLKGKSLVSTSVHTSLESKPDENVSHTLSDKGSKINDLIGMTECNLEMLVANIV